MEDKLKRLEQETELDYHKRLVYGKLVDKTLSEIDYTELAPLVYGKEYSSDVARRMLYGSRYTLDLIDKLKTENIDDNEILNELNSKILELKKERVKLNTEKQQLNKDIREQARVELYFEKIEELAEKQRQTIKVPTFSYVDSKEINEGVLAIADIHYGSKYKVYGLHGEIINEYNISIFEQKMWELFHKTLSKCEKEGINKLHIYNLGDSIENALHISQLQSLECGVIEAVIGFQTFMANWLNELSKCVYIDYYASDGNHDEMRILTGKKGDMPNENLQRLITHYIKSVLKDNKNITVHETHNGLHYTNMNGYNILSVHGDNEKNLEQSIKDYMITYGIKIDLMLSAHLHTNHSKVVGMTEDNNIQFIQCPSLCGANPYSIKLKKVSKSGAKMIVLNSQDSDLVTYDFIL